MIEVSKERALAESETGYPLRLRGFLLMSDGSVKYHLAMEPRVERAGQLWWRTYCRRGAFRWLDYMVS